MAFLDTDGQLGTLGKFGLMLQSFADPTIIPTYQKQQIEMQDRQMKLDEINRLRQREQALQNLAARMGGTGAVPSAPGVMGPMQPQPAMKPLEALAQMAAIDPQYIDDYINLQAKESDPMRQLELKKLQMEIANLGRPAEPSKQELALSFLSNLQQPAQQQTPAGGLADFDTMMQQQGFLPQQPQGMQQPDIGRNIQTAMALENLGIKGKIAEDIYGQINPAFNAPPIAERQAKADVLKEFIEQTQQNTMPQFARAKQAINASGTGGFIGGASQSIWGTPAFKLKREFDPIKTVIFLDKLIQMKESSPQGASGLGALSVPEMEALKGRIASLELGQDDAVLERNLDIVQEEYNRLLKKAAKGYKEITGQEIPIQDWSTAKSNDQQRTDIISKYGLE